MQHNVDVALLSCNGPILMEGNECSDDYGKRLLRIVRARQTNGAVQPIPRLYKIIRNVCARKIARTTFELVATEGEAI